MSCAGAHCWQLALPVALLFVLGQCEPSSPSAARTPPLRIGIDLWAGYYPLILADELGYLKQEGVTIEVSIPRDTDRMLAQFAAREHDAVAVSLGDIINVTRIVADIRLVLVADESAGGDQVLGQAPVRGPDDLRGKTIGTNLGGFGELLVRRFLQRQGLTPADVRLLNAEAATVPERLATRELDFGHTWEPYASQAIANGAVPVFSSADTPGLVLDGLIFRGEVLQQRRAEVQGLVRAWFRAVDWWRDHREAGNRLVEQRLSLQPGEAAPRGIRLLDGRANRDLMVAIRGEAPLHTVAACYIDFFTERGTLSRRPDAATLIDASFLP